MMKHILFFEEISSNDVPIVGGKNASLGELIRELKSKNILVPNGFAVSAKSFYYFLEKNQIKDKIFSLLKKIGKDKKNLQKIGAEIRAIILEASIPEDLEKEIVHSYKILSKEYDQIDVDVAVRSSATAEDLPNASFAGQHESYLNIQGEKKLLLSCKKCLASLFEDRAIAYRIEKGFNHEKVALSIGVQKMVRSDKASSGVIFTLDTETGFDKVITITAGLGLGENIVQGKIIPDEYELFKPFFFKKNVSPIIEKILGEKEKKLIYSKGKKTTVNINTTKRERESFALSDDEIIKLGLWASEIEKHYKMPMDIEWAKDGILNKIFIVQARPETVKSQQKDKIYHSFSIKEKTKPILTGIAIGDSITAGKVQIIKSVAEIKKFKKGSILVTSNTTPDWVPIMKIAKGIITDHGGRTSHAAIVSRELAIPAIVGTKVATKKLKDSQEITLSCIGGNIGSIYPKILKYDQIEEDLSNLPKIEKPKIMINIASPSAAFRFWQLPCHGIGLARMEFIINNMIKIHPMALIHLEKVKNKKTQNQIIKLTKGYKNRKNYFVDILSQGIAKIAASQYPEEVIVRLSDFKSNEYASLIGGSFFEEREENPMLGFRGASRYYNERYKEAFDLECIALKKARDILGFDNLIIMIPFCRTLEEADKVLSLLAKNGLKRKQNGLKIYMMSEIPSNIILADKFAEKFDGFSIGSNDLTQLILGIDRDSELLAPLFDAGNEAVKIAIKDLIQKAHKNNCKVGICGQAPSDNPEFAQFLINNGIDSISLNPDSVINTIKKIKKYC